MDDSKMMDMLTNDTDVDLASIPIFPNYPKELLTFAYSLCIVFILVGIPANLITIIALAICKKFRNATAIFIINLHMSNLLFCCLVLPVTATTFFSESWVLGRTMCNVYPLLKYSLNCTAHLTVVAITINRYIIICYPRAYPRFYKRKFLIITLISTWIVSFALFLPSFFGVWGRFDLNLKGGEGCTMCTDKTNGSNPKILFLILAFAGPYIIFIVCYSQIWWTVRKAAKNCPRLNSRVQPTMSNNSSDASIAENGIVFEPSTYENNSEYEANNANSPVLLIPDGQSNTVKQFFRNTFKVNENKEQLQLPTRKDKKLATMIAALMVTFTLCHLPIMLSRVLYGEYKSHPYVYVLVHMMEYSSAFLSPIIYVIMSSEYRQVYASLFHDVKVGILKLFKS